MAQKLEILPAAPRFLEPVYVRIHPDSFAQNPFGATVSMAGNKITVRYFSFPDIGSYTYDVELGRFPAGSYSVEVIGVSGPATTQFDVADAERSPQYPGSIPAVNYLIFHCGNRESSAPVPET